MIELKSKEEIKKMRNSGRIVAEVLRILEPYIKPGVTTLKLDRIAHDFIVKKKPSRLLRITEGIRQRFVRPLITRSFTESRERESSLRETS